MTIYSRYLINRFCRLFGLIIGSFIAFSIICRIEEIAFFASLGVPPTKLLQFSSMQVPYLLTPTISIATLVATIILIHRLCESRELVALRASGWSLTQIISPLLLAATLISLATFYLTSEVSTYCHRRSREMMAEVTGLNPLIMLEHPSTKELTGAYVRMDPIHQGSEAANVIIAIPGKQLALALIDHLKIDDGQLQGNYATWLTTLTNPKGFNHLVLENMDTSHSPALELAGLLHQKGWKLAADHLSWRLLNARQKQLALQTDGKSQLRIKKCLSEKARRLSFGLLPFTFVWIAIAFSIQTTRIKSKRYLFILILLPALTLLSIILGKEFDYDLRLSIPLFFAPHVLLIFCSLIRLKQIAIGK